MMHRTGKEILSLLFYRIYDESYCRQALEEICRNNLNKCDFLGEGTHFKSFRIKEKAGQLVVNHLKGCEVEYSSIEIKKWRAALEKLRKIETCLIPPYEIITFEKNLGIVLPFGTEKPTTIGVENFCMEQKIEQTLKNLSETGLEIADEIQIKYFESIPFISDLSDLRFIPA